LRSASYSRAVVCALLVIALLASPAYAGEPMERSLAAEGGLGISAALLNIGYCPTKLAYALGGIALTGLSWAWTWGDSSVANGIYRAALAGDYVITPDHLTGKKDIEFSGN
jgi:hypothetical protein